MEFNLYGFKSFDELLAFHCAPALKAVKPANLFSCPASAMPTIEPLLEKYTSLFKNEGIAFEVLCHCKVNTLVLVYLPEKLDAILQNTKIQKFLSEEGYELGDSQKMLKQLGDKIVRSHSFPHEIGIFLGYPLEDIVGFIENKGKNWKHNDYWKVYGDEVEAKKLFKKYNDCRNHLMQAVADGIPLHLAVKSA